MENRTFSLQISTPCQQPWNAMTPADKGRHCDACNLVVIDFSAMSPAEIKSYFQNNCGKKICGRFRESQLTGNEKHSLHRLYRRVLNLQTRYPKLSLFLFATIGMMVLAGCPPKEDRVFMGDTTYVQPQAVDSTVVDSIGVK